MLLARRRSKRSTLWLLEFTGMSDTTISMNQQKDKQNTHLFLVMKSIIFLFKFHQSVVSYPAGCFSVVFVFFVVYLLTMWLNRNVINPSSPWSRGLGSQVFEDLPIKVLGDLPINQFNGIQYCEKILFQSTTTVFLCSVDHWQISQCLCLAGNDQLLGT